MSKKAFTVYTGYFPKLVLAGFILVILFYMVSNVFHVVPEKIEEKGCSSFVKMVATLKDPFTKKTRVDLNKACPTRHVLIKARGKNDEERRKNALDDVLYEMYVCGRWGFKYGKVEEIPFSQEITKVCVVCSNITFDKTLRGMKELKGLAKRSAEAYLPGTGKTYYEFFTDMTPSEDIENELAAFKIDGEEPAINTSEQQYIIYSVNMHATTEDVLTKTGIGALLGMGTGTLPAMSLLPLKLAASLIGVKVRLAYVIMGFGIAGAAGGAYLGTTVAEQADGAIFISPGKVEEIAKHCKTLGRDPFEDPWKEEIIEG